MAFMIDPRKRGHDWFWLEESCLAQAALILTLAFMACLTAPNEPDDTNVQCLAMVSKNSTANAASIARSQRGLRGRSERACSLARAPACAWTTNTARTSAMTRLASAVGGGSGGGYGGNGSATAASGGYGYSGYAYGYGYGDDNSYGYSTGYGYAGE